MKSLQRNLKYLLIPFSGLYFIITWLRNRLYDSGFMKVHNNSLPVVCVGNIQAGGTGKSLIVRKIASSLLKKGLKPVILMRGYKGKEILPYLVSSSSTPIECGDEALEHFLFFGNKIPVVTSVSRYKGVEHIKNNSLGDIVVMDDGFQHRKLDRDIDIVVVPKNKINKSF